MKFLDEYRDPIAADKLLRLIDQKTTRSWTIMEICGGQSHTIIKYGIDELLPPQISLVHGPGCPVCVTPVEQIDKAVRMASQPDVIFCSFGDMLRVPGRQGDLLSAKAGGGDVRIVYSPLDCLRVATENPQRTVVFFAVGFETTAPANAMAVWQAKRRGITNFAVLVSHVLVPPAMQALLSNPNHRIQGFLAAGHVCTVMGYDEYEPLAEQFRVPIVVTGFEPLDMLEGFYRCVSMLEEGRYGVENAYTRVVRREGNPQARALLEEVFEVTDYKWRGIGVIPQSGYRLRPEYAGFDAELRFPGEAVEKLGQAPCSYAKSSQNTDVRSEPVPFFHSLGAESGADDADSTLCISGQILQGLKKPPECAAFRTSCTPERPLGATMVSSEGACAAYYHFGRLQAASAANDFPAPVEGTHRG
ncbi:MAG TPA: hydrogenase formation protein HypD [Pirellulaceae bacterium]|nr:hydrogenase formation protein HypD [Pirellulaceae bacterium]